LIEKGIVKKIIHNGIRIRTMPVMFPPVNKTTPKTAKISNMANATNVLNKRPLLFAALK
jgi:hypothetical protein